MSRLTNVTHQRLTEALDFDPATGIFVWKIATSNRVKIGTRAGVLHAVSGGRYIALDGEKFMAHRLAWFYAKGKFPAHDIRPNDGNYDNCAIDNLSEISRVELQHGRGRVASNTSGYQGVSKAKGGYWQSKITWNYQQIALGANFETAEEAGEAYQIAAETLKTAKSPEDIKTAVAAFRLSKRQRAAWNNVLRTYPENGWSSFEDFAKTVAETHDLRYAMAPINATMAIGPSNWKWALPIDSVIHTRDGRVAYQRAKRNANLDLHRDRDFRRKYGVDFAQFQQMLLEQKGVCAICEKPETKVESGTIRLLSVDHNHTTGEVRGLLCSNCNMAIGYACDDVTTLQKAIGYLRKHAGVETVLPFETTRPDRDWLLVASPLSFGT